MKSITRAYNKFLFKYAIPLLDRIPFINAPTTIDVYKKLDIINGAIGWLVGDYVMQAMHKSAITNLPKFVEETRNDIEVLIREGHAIANHFDGIAYLSDPGDEPMFRPIIDPELINGDFNTKALLQLTSRVALHVHNSENLTSHIESLHNTLLTRLNENLPNVQKPTHFTQTPEWQAYNLADLAAMDSVEKMKQNTPQTN